MKLGSRGHTARLRRKIALGKVCVKGRLRREEKNHVDSRYYATAMVWRLSGCKKAGVVHMESEKR